ncbi:MAG: ATP-binding cassette domain-containing protein [Flavobacteriales bacterium]
MLIVRNLRLSYDEKVFADVSFTLRPKAIYGIVGESGAGKSSLLNIIAGITDPDQGEMMLDGVRLPYASQQLVPGRSRIALVPQDFQLDLYHTVEENVREAILTYPEPKRQKKVSEVLSWLNLIKHKNKLAKDLSGGEKQRLAIARALAKDPEWLLLDEPFSHLDFARKNTLIQYVKNIPVSRGIGVMVVSHEAHDLLTLCGKIAVLSRGKLSSFKKAPNVYFSLKNVGHARLLGCVNEINHDGTLIRFRPSQYVLDPVGIPLKLSRYYFNGLAYVHEFKTRKDEPVVLYAQGVLSPSITIKIL